MCRASAPDGQRKKETTAGSTVVSIGNDGEPSVVVSGDGRSQQPAGESQGPMLGVPLLLHAVGRVPSFSASVRHGFPFLCHVVQGHDVSGSVDLTDFFSVGSVDLLQARQRIWPKNSGERRPG
jgi:hypothetical protein